MADQEPFEISSQHNVPKEGNMTIVDLSTITLARGMHDTPGDGMCLLEAAAYLAGEPFSDHPQCVCPVLAAFGRSWNDSLDDQTRNRLLKPFLPRLLNTRSTPDVQDRRAFMAADWAVRTYTPAWLRLAGLNDHADALADLPELTSVQAFRDARAVTQASRMAAAAAWAAARDAAWDAARERLAPTAHELRAEAHRLVDRMLAVTESTLRDVAVEIEAVIG